MIKGRWRDRKPSIAKSNYFNIKHSDISSQSLMNNAVKVFVLLKLPPHPDPAWH